MLHFCSHACFKSAVFGQSDRHDCLSISHLAFSHAIKKQDSSTLKPSVIRCFAQTIVRSSRLFLSLKQNFIQEYTLSSQNDNFCLEDRILEEKIGQGSCWQMQHWRGFVGVAAGVPVQIRSRGNVSGMNQGCYWRGATKGKGRGGSPGLGC